jgi:hypothetical protein
VLRFPNVCAALMGLCLGGLNALMPSSRASAEDVGTSGAAASAAQSPAPSGTRVIIPAPPPGSPSVPAPAPVAATEQAPAQTPVPAAPAAPSGLTAPAPSAPAAATGFTPQDSPLLAAFAPGPRGQPQVPMDPLLQPASGWGDYEGLPSGYRRPWRRTYRVRHYGSPYSYYTPSYDDGPPYGYGGYGYAPYYAYSRPRVGLGLGLGIGFALGRFGHHRGFHHHRHFW